MNYLIASALGFGMAFVGIVLPGMLNMTAMTVGLQRGQRAGLQFITGSAVTTGLQALVALIFADVLRRNPHLLYGLKQWEILMFVLLASIFMFKAKQQQPIKTKAPKSGKKNFGAGFLLGFANFLAVPYFVAVSSWLVTHVPVNRSMLSVGLFGLGASVGSFCVFRLYLRSASWVSNHAAWLAHHINLVMALFFLCLAGLQLYLVYG